MSLAVDFVTDLVHVAPFLSAPPATRLKPLAIANSDLEALGIHLKNARNEITKRVESLLRTHAAKVPDSPLLSNVSLFKSIGMCRQETVHTNALTWLLDPTQQHGFGRKLLHSLMHAGGAASWFCEQLINHELSVQRVLPELALSPSCRIDIFAEGVLNDGRPWVLLVEAKIDALERAQQLLDYDRALDTRLGSRARESVILRIFLNPEGRLGKTSGHNIEWNSLSYLTLAKAFLVTYPELRECAGQPFLKLYLSGLLEDVCSFACRNSVDDVLRYNEAPHLMKLLGQTND